jgi:predicted transcriptional regulator
VVGSATIERIIRGSPEEVWGITSDCTAIDRGAFDAYFDGVDEAIGLVLSNVKRGKPIPIEILRTLRVGFHPPQVIARISSVEAISFHLLSMTSQAPE